MDPYDPDNFDWGDDNPVQDSADQEIGDMEAFIAAALLQHEETFGWTYIKAGDVKERAKRLYRSKIIVPSHKDRAFLESEWPAYNFVWDHATVHHDHPVSHLMTELNSLEMTQDLVSADKAWIDLFGNSGKAKKYKQKCFVLYQKNTPKDYIRYQNPGVRDIELDMRSLCDPDSYLGKIDDVVVVHSLYYMKMNDIARILHTSPGRKIRALVHRHPETAGYLNNGELSYVVDRKGVVTQTNVLTGESYTHPSLEALFHQDSARTPLGGVAWTTRKAGGDAFYIDLVGCSNKVAKEFVPLWALEEESRVTVESEGINMHTFLHWSWITHSRGKSEVTLWDTGLLKKLRRYVSGKARTPLLKRELSNYCRRLTNEADIISIHGGGAHEVDIAEMIDYVEAAFYIDVKHELETAIAFAKKHQVEVAALNAYYEKGAVPKDFTRVTRVAKWTAHQVREKIVPPVTRGASVVGGFAVEVGWLVANDAIESCGGDSLYPPLKCAMLAPVDVDEPPDDPIRRFTSMRP